MIQNNTTSQNQTLDINNSLSITNNSSNYSKKQDEITTISKISGKLKLQDYLLWIIVALVIFTVFSLIARILIPFISAALIAYIFEPLVQKLARKKISRPLSAVIILLFLLLTTIGLFSLLLPLITTEIIPLFAKTQELPILLKGILIKSIPSINWDIYLNAEYFKTLIVNNKDTVFSLISNLQKKLLLTGGNIFEIIMNLVLFPVALFYFISAWPQFSENVQTILPPQIRNKTLGILREIDGVLDEYFHGQILVMLILAVYYSLSLSLISFPNGFSLGILIGLLVLLPYIGFSFGFGLCIFISLLHSDEQLLFWVIGIFIIGQLLESYLLTPYLVGERIGLHPLLVIFVLIAFGNLFGFAGILIALPASAIILVLLRHFKNFYQQSKFYRLS